MSRPFHPLRSLRDARAKEVSVEEGKFVAAGCGAQQAGGPRYPELFFAALTDSPVHSLFGWIVFLDLTGELGPESGDFLGEEVALTRVGDPLAAAIEEAEAVAQIGDLGGVGLW